MAVTDQSVLDGLLERQSGLVKEVEGLSEARTKAYSEFQTQLNGDARPTDEEVQRFETRRNHQDEAVRPTDEEVRSFESRVNSGPSESEIRDFNSAHGERRAVIQRKMKDLDEVNEQIEEQRKLGRSLTLAQEASKWSGPAVTRQRDPMTYRQDNENEHSYFLDLAAAQNLEVRSNPDPRLDGFMDRLDRHAREMNDVLPERWSRRKREAEEKVEQAEDEFRSRARLRRTGLETSPFERNASLRGDVGESGDLEERAPSRIVGQGGLQTLAAVAA